MWAASASFIVLRARDDTHNMRWLSILCATKRSSSMARPHTRIRVEPRLSANDLAKFMVSSETARVGILRRAKEVSTAVVIRYSDVRSVLRTAVASPARAREIIDTARDLFLMRSTDMALSAFARDDASGSLDVLDNFAVVRDRLAGLECIPAPSNQERLNISGVEVSVNCDILIQREHRNQQEIGGALFRLTKPEEDASERSIQRRRDMGGYAAALVLMHVTEHHAANRTAAGSISLSIDVQSGEAQDATRAFATRRQNLENACRFITAVWPTL